MKTRVSFALILVSVALVAAWELLGTDTSDPEPKGTRQKGSQPPKTLARPVAHESGNYRDRRLRRQQRQIDPRHDGWDTEVFTEVADRQLAILSSAISQWATSHDGSDCEKPFAAARQTVIAAFDATAMRPSGLTPFWRRDGMTVFRPSSSPTRDKAAHYQGPEGLIEAIRGSRGESPAAEQCRVKLKTYRVSLVGPVAVTFVKYHAAAFGPQRAVEQSATWRCRWRLVENGAPVAKNDGGKAQEPRPPTPKLEAIEVSDYEEIVASFPATTLFSDCTQALLGKHAAFTRQLAKGLNHWVSTIDRSYRNGITERYGLALGDVNGDGLEDVYICQPVGVPNRLLVQTPEGALVDRSREAGVDWLDHTSAALFADLDNDGDQDLVTATLYRVLFMENDGTGKFRLNRTMVISEWDVHALSAVDYDNDGDLDVFLSVSTGARQEEHPDSAWYDVKTGGRNALFRNDISASKSKRWSLTDVTVESGLDKENYRVTLAAAWEDYDDDGDQDLYLANDFGPNQFFRNDGGRFKEVSVDAGVVDYGSGMSVSWGDFNRDGRMDLYVANMFSSAGNRITYQTHKIHGFEDEEVPIIQRFVKGNSLFQHAGDRFREVSRERGLEVGLWAWCSLFVDVNNDGWDDVLVANGFLTGDGDDGALDL